MRMRVRFAHFRATEPKLIGAVMEMRDGPSMRACGRLNERVGTP